MLHHGPVPLLEEGVHGGRPLVEPDGRLPKPALRLGAARTLAALGDLVFFSPAALYVARRLSDAQLVDCLWEYGQRIDFWHTKFRHPLFAGLDVANDPDWNYVLWAVATTHWPTVRDFILSCCFVDPGRQLVEHAALQVFTMLDPLAVEKELIRGTTAQATVAVFGLNGNRRRLAFQVDPRSGLPRLVRLDPDPAMAVFADALFAGQNPHTARQHFQEQPAP